MQSSFEQLLADMQVDFVDVGMIHYIDNQADFDQVYQGPVMAYARRLQQEGKIRSIGLSTHNQMCIRDSGDCGR